jgi:hypothetical protein
MPEVLYAPALSGLKVWECGLAVFLRYEFRKTYLTMIFPSYKIDSLLKMR